MKVALFARQSINRQPSLRMTGIITRLTSNHSSNSIIKTKDRTFSSTARLAQDNNESTKKVNHNVISTLSERGLISYLSHQEADMQKLVERPIGIYIGFDPTADSLHLGSLVPVVALAHFLRAGHNVVALVGGATGMIGDPSGRSTERNLLDTSIIEHNVSCLKEILQRCLSNSLQLERESSSSSLSPGKFQLVNNLDWYKDMNVIAFLRDIGKHFRVNSMIAKDSVKVRMESQEGISFTEFSYQLFQAYDFVQLCQRHQVIMQVGGSDQWGNISEGIFLLGRLLQKSGFGLTLPLMTTASGQKLGKSTGVGNAVWLSENKTSVYDFYQFFLRLSDEDALKYLPIFTFLPLSTIRQIVKEHNQDPSKRLAQKTLADNVTTFVHGTAALEKAKAASNVLFGGQLFDLTWQQIETGLADAPRVTLNRDQIIHSNIINLAAAAKVSSSKSEIKRLIEGSGLYFNNQLVTDKNMVVQEKDILEDKFCVFRSGKKNFRIVLVERAQ